MKKRRKEEKIKSLVKGPLFKRHKPLHYSSGYRVNKDIKREIEKRYNILTTIIVLAVIVLLGSLFVIQIVHNEHYKAEMETLTQKVIDGPSAPRGRIYDRNGKIIVDNKANKVIYYQKPSNVTTKDEMEVAYKLADMISVDYSKLSNYNFKIFWLKNNKEKGKKKITDEEWDLLEKRKITADEIEKLKIERITDDDLSIYDENDKKAAYIYTLMNTGYSYEEKDIKNVDVTDTEYALVGENISTLKGVNTKLDWERVYPNGDVFKSMIGAVSSSKSGIPAELKDYYLKKGYSLNDRVGTSYLEYQYEDILKGKKNKYQVTSDGSYKLIEEGTRGNDIALSIDIDLQKAVEDILIEEVTRTKKEANTEYYNRSFVIVTNPNTGEVLAMAGKQIKEENGETKIYDYTPGVLTSPVVMGSVVKGASQIVGYNTGALKIGEYRQDTCIKIAATPEKCSWKYLGRINDITALAQSSNTYQFHTAIKVGKGHYTYNKPLTVDKSAFDTYRNTFKQFGLGVKTGIDLPVESLGYKGSKTTSGYLLDFSIGQYDTYTPIQLAQYIGTIANGGKRMQPYLYKGIYKDGKIIKETEPKELNKVDTKAEFMDRVHQGFEAVLKYGTGAGYIDMTYKPAGKTGTSQSFIDTDNDGVVDKETITTTFAAYAPSDNPKVTFTVISPDVSRSDGRTTHQSSINRRIAGAISKKYFEIYK
ncbi:MAG: penicillin-binding protein 2 [Bacilli bacterium]|nr:penicillin-binding protein 2 [Bacilli bacterium]